MTFEQSSEEVREWAKQISERRAFDIKGIASEKTFRHVQGKRTPVWLEQGEPGVVIWDEITELRGGDGEGLDENCQNFTFIMNKKHPHSDPSLLNFWISRTKRRCLMPPKRKTGHLLRAQESDWYQWRNTFQILGKSNLKWILFAANS